MYQPKKNFVKILPEKKRGTPISQPLQCFSSEERFAKKLNFFCNDKGQHATKNYTKKFFLEPIREMFYG